MKEDKAHIRIKKGKDNVTQGVWNVVITEGTEYTIQSHIGGRWTSVEIVCIERDTVHDYEIKRFPELKEIEQ